MKVLLVSIDSKFIHSNLAVRYIKNFCKKSDIVEIKEFTINQEIWKIAESIISSGANLICFSTYIWNVEIVKELVRIIKKAYPKIDILLGGPEVSFEVKKIMEENLLIDYIIYGEGEQTFDEFLDEYVGEKEYCGIDGLVYRSVEGDIVINKARELLLDLDELACPYEQDIDIHNKIVYYESSRGCPFNCSFCMSSIDKKLRNFSMKRVKNDLMKLLNLNIRQIKFVDRTFNADYKRAMEIMNFIIDNNKGKINVHFEITADIINDEFLDYLHKLPVNMFQFEIGVQSLNLTTLNEINRKTNIDRLFEVLNKIKSFNNIHMHLDLIAGLPYEDYISFKKSFNYIHNLYIDKLQLGFLKVLKGTNIYKDIELHGMEYNDKAPYEIIRNKYISYKEILRLKEIEELVERYYNEKYFEKTMYFVINSVYGNDAFEFYERFSDYWRSNGLYNSMHSKKKLYIIFRDFAEKNSFLSQEFLNNLMMDFMCCNEKDELLPFFDRENEELYRGIKKKLAKDKNFRYVFFNLEDMNYKLLNDFRIVKIGLDMWLFIYRDKKNIFERCKTYNITEYIREINYDEQDR